jgi:hypothetical protein
MAVASGPENFPLNLNLDLPPVFQHKCGSPNSRLGGPSSRLGHPIARLVGPISRLGRPNSRLGFLISRPGDRYPISELGGHTGGFGIETRRPDFKIAVARFQDRGPDIKTRRPFKTVGPDFKTGGPDFKTGAVDFKTGAT